MKLEQTLNIDEERRMQKYSESIRYSAEHPFKFITRVIFEPTYLLRTALNVPKTKKTEKI
ncbi:hypothetical protein HYW75_00635 [Candidatus Pacearchaeota archaeon]|nr:hypothetical protein [Candidatus Pacearchaeota archaeon]